MAAIPSNLTSLDFFEIRESIKSYLRTRTEFTDYDFEGSAASYLLDVLAYNTYYSSFNANMALNETFLETATVRDNVVKLARMLNFTPHSIKASKAAVRLEIKVDALPNETTVYPDFVVIKPGDQFVSTVGADSYTFALLEETIVLVNQSTGTAVIQCLVIYQGNYLSYNYTVDNTSTQEYIIPTEDVDTDHIKVTVRPSSQSEEQDTYKIVSNITEIESTSRIFFLEESDDLRYKIVFGDGIIGRKLINGEYITINYIRTDGEDANGCKKFYFIGAATDAIGRPIGANRVKVELMNSSQDGVPAESIASIKYRAPRLYTAQYRAVTEQDYEQITKLVYPSAKAVRAFGGQRATPPVYGKVYITIQTTTGAPLNTATKAQIVNDLRSYSIASVEPVIVDATNLYIDLKSFVYFDPQQTSLSASDISARVTDSVKGYSAQSGLGQFGGRIDYSKLMTLIDSADESIKGNVTQVRLSKKWAPEWGQNSSQCLEFDQPISNPSDTSGSNCDPKNSSIISGEFYMPEYTERVVNLKRSTSSQFDSSIVSGSDNVLVPLQVRDDGKGNMILFTKVNATEVILKNNVGTVDYSGGKVCIGPLNITGVPTSLGITQSPIPISGLPSSPNIVANPGTTLIFNTPIIIPKDVNVTPFGDPNFDPTTTTPPSTLTDITPTTPTTPTTDPSVTGCFS